MITVVLLLLFVELLRAGATCDETQVNAQLDSAVDEFEWFDVRNSKHACRRHRMLDCSIGRSEGNDCAGFCSLPKYVLVDYRRSGSLEHSGVDCHYYCDCMRRKCSCDDDDDNDRLRQRCSLATTQCSACNSRRPQQQRNVAVFSTTYDDDYLFFTPLTALIWRAEMRYDTACVFVGPSPALNVLHSFVIDESLRMGVDIFWIESEANVKDATLSQISRFE
jgi:hypothetical protein